MEQFWKIKEVFRVDRCENFYEIQRCNWYTQNNVLKYKHYVKILKSIIVKCLRA